jgi:hypothetical protein
VLRPRQVRRRRSRPSALRVRSRMDRDRLFHAAHQLRYGPALHELRGQHHFTLLHELHRQLARRRLQHSYLCPLLLDPLTVLLLMRCLVTLSTTAYCLSVNEYQVFPECSGHGSCSVGGSSGQPACQCRPGWEPGSLNDCFTGTRSLLLRLIDRISVETWLWAATCAAGEEEKECSGHGVCSTDLASPACMCDAFFYGNSCTICTSPSAFSRPRSNAQPCMPPTDEEVCPGYPDECTSSENGMCVNGTCQCTDKWRGNDCSVARCPGAEENCNGRGRCDSSADPAECRCDAHWTGADCSIRTLIAPFVVAVVIFLTLIAIRDHHTRSNLSP